MDTSNYVVIGANGGIGADVCRRLVAQGSRVMLAGRNERALAELSARIESPYRVIDATVFEEVHDCCVASQEVFGSIQGIVNCAGSILLKPAHLTSLAEWSDTLAANLTSAFAAVRAGYHVMRKEGGSIVLVSSVAARLGLANHEAIAAAKAGVEGLTRSAAASYAGRGVRVNAVAPGLIRTKMTERIWKSDKAAEQSRMMHPLGRLGEPEDVASMIEWLLLPENSWISGQVFSVDGGMSTVRSASR